MRYLVVAALMAVGVVVFGVGGASAAPASGQPISQNAEQASSVTKIAGGCGHGWHRNRWGRWFPGGLRAEKINSRVKRDARQWRAFPSFTRNIAAALSPFPCAGAVIRTTL